MVSRFHFPFVALAIVAACFLAGCATTPITYEVGETQKGRASWYGAEQGRQTSSGERFNPRALTAAHRHLPFGTIVRVTNLCNGRSVDVRINDRGPWGGDHRIIDVTSAAADALQMKKMGVIPIEIEIVHLGDGRRYHKG